MLLSLLVGGCSTTPRVEPVQIDEPLVQLKPEERINRWKRLIGEMRPARRMEQLSSANDFFNQLDFVDDIDHWGKEDYWATPEEMLTTFGGDCEDFTVAKYLTLRAMRVPEEHLRMTVVKSLRLNQPHMVLSYYPRPQDEPLVLDNLVKSIVPASRRKDLVPIYSFNGESMWLVKSRGQSERVGGPEQVGLWREFLDRVGAAYAWELEK